MMATGPVEATSVAAALALLALAGFFARLVRNTGPSPLRRVLIPAFYYVISILLIVGMPALLTELSVATAVSLALILLWMAVPALITAAALDGVATLLGAERTPQWLTIGIIAAVIAAFAWLAALNGALLREIGMFAFLLVVPAAGSAITWWPYLPVPEGEGPDDEAAAEVFD